MREVQIDELKGYWRCEDDKIRRDLAIKSGISWYTEILQESKKIPFEVQGTALIVDLPERRSKAIQIKNHQLLIWSMDLSNDEIILDLGDNVQRRFLRIAGTGE